MPVCIYKAFPFQHSGASSGIGAATAVLFSKLGATLALTGRKEDNLKKVGEECSKNTSDQVTNC